MNHNEIHSADFNIGIVICWGIQEVKHEGDASGAFIRVHSMYFTYAMWLLKKVYIWCNYPILNFIKILKWYV